MPPTRPRTVACSVCRQAKMKCIPGSEGNRCERCVRWNRECVYESHRNSRNPVVRRTPDKRILPTAVSSSSQQRQDESGCASNSISGADFNPFQSHVTDYPIFNYGPQQSFPPSNSSSSDAGVNLNRAAALSPLPFVGLSEDVRNLSLEVALDPQQQLSEGSRSGSDVSSVPQNRYLSQENDPIALKILSFPSAEFLYNGFFQHFNSLVGAIDPDLYTAIYCRSESPILFTVILSIASRVFRPELRQVLRDHVEKLLGKALLDSDSSVSTIWAIICLYYWKDVNDKRGYNLVGFALRMASSAEWNHIGQREFEDPFPENTNSNEQMERRKHRDKLRVWILLGNLDRSASYFTNRPFSTNPNNTRVASRSWLGNVSTTYLNGESTAIAGNELNDLSRKLYEFVIQAKLNQPLSRNDPTASSASQQELEDTTFEVLMQEFYENIQKWGDFWGPHYRKYTFPANEPCVYIYQEHIRLYFSSIKLQRLVTRSSSYVWGEAECDAVLVCFESATELLKQVLILAELQTLYYLWDTCHLMTGYSAMMLGKILQHANNLSQDKRNEGLETLVQLANAHAEAAASIAFPSDSSISGKSEDAFPQSPLHMQARYLKSIVTRVKHDYASKAAAFSFPTGQVHDSNYFDATLQSQAHSLESYEFDFESTGFGPSLHEHIGAASASMEIYASSSAYDETDCLLDSDFLIFESRLPWVIPDIFPETT